MLYVNSNHPDFDFDMEILCTIPRYPASARMDELARDFGLDKRTDVIPHLKKLVKRGYKVETMHGSPLTGLEVTIKGDILGEAYQDAEVYWQNVYAPVENNVKTSEPETTTQQ